MCEANCVVSSLRYPVRTLTTPGGTSEACSTSAKLTAQSGSDSDASTTQVLPPTIAGPTRPLTAAATLATTPGGTSTALWMCDEPTGTAARKMCWYLSAQPA